MVCMCLCSTDNDFLSSFTMYNTPLLVIHVVQRNAFEYTNATVGQKAWIVTAWQLWVIGDFVATPCYRPTGPLWPLLLTWINFYPSMDK